jgi:hypothetical protein
LERLARYSKQNQIIGNLLMIQCPLCQEYVRNEFGTGYLADDETDDCYCPTDVMLNKKLWCHYARQTFTGQGPEHTIIIPPYRIYWWEREKQVNIQIIGEDDSWFKLQHTVCEYDNVDKIKLLKICKRFTNLRAFL